MRIVQHGVNQIEAKVVGAAGTFWATRENWLAINYATMSPSNGDGMVVAFNIPKKILDELVANRLAERDLHKMTYEFLPPSFETINSAISDIEVTAVPDK